MNLPVGIADEIQKLRQLHFNGALSDDEFTQAKSKLLGSPPPVPAPTLTPFIEEQLAEVRYQNELARIDREWEIEREQYQIVGRYGRSILPTVGMGLASILTGIAVGILLFGGVFVTSRVVNNFFPDFEHAPKVMTAVVVIATLITVVPIARGVDLCVRAAQYAAALGKYQARRRQAESQAHPIPSSPR